MRRRDAAFLNGLARLAVLVLAVASAHAADIILVKGTVSTPNEAERNYADSMARNMGRWLTEAGIPHAVTDDAAVGAQSLAPARLVILPYNPFPPKAELWALKTYLKNGGQLMVFYGADAGLAEAMGMKLGEPAYAPRGGRFSSITFNDAAPPHLPSTVRQESRIVRPALPVGGRSRAIAFWQNAEGTRSTDPAWIQSSRGFWMSHVLLDDGDSGNKKQMLLGLIASVNPTVWRPASERALADAATLGGKYAGFDSAVAALTQLAAGSPNESQVAASLGRAAELHRDILELRTAGRCAEMVEKSQALRRVLVDAYAGVQNPRANEIRAVWDHAGVGLYPGDWNRTCRVLSDSGFSDVYANVLMSGVAHYRSAVLQPSEAFRQYGDQIEQGVAAAHRNGLKFHAWKVCWKYDGAPEAVQDRLRRQGRFQRSDTGKPINWLCPSRPENVELELASIREIVQKYPVDGIQLDYIRYYDSHYCYCPVCRTAFERDTGRRVANWPGDVRQGDLKAVYTRWRRGQITRFVRQVHETVRGINPKVAISAAVYGTWKTCPDSIGQDWPTWLKEGTIDVVCPMNYASDPAAFAGWVQGQMTLPNARGRLVSGIGVSAKESRLDPVQVMDQIVTTRKAGTAGFILFDLRRGLEKDYLPLLRRGLTREDIRIE